MNFELGVFFEFSNAYLFVTKNGLIEQVNQRFLDAFGYQSDELLGRPILDLILPMDQEKFKQFQSDFISCSAQILNTDKRVKMVEWQGIEKEGLVYIKGEDITDVLKQQERFSQYSTLLKGVNESLERSSHRLFLLQNSLTNTLPYAPDSIKRILDVTTTTMGFDFAVCNLSIGNQQLKITDHNCSFLDFQQHTRKDKAAIAYTVFNKAEMLVVKDQYNTIELGPQEVQQVKNYVGLPLKFNNQVFGVLEFVSQNAGVLQNMDSNDYQFLKLVADVVGRVIELRKINIDLEEKTEKLATKNKELDEFAYIVSHDLKAPLRAIRNLIGFINDGVEEKISDQEVINDLQLIDSRAERLAGMIDGILKYSRVGREAAPVSQFSTQNIIEEAIEQLKPMNEKAEFLVAPNFPEVVYREMFFYQVIGNILSNSIKYNDKAQPIIRLAFNDEGRYLKIFIDDNGPGIPDQFK